MNKTYIVQFRNDICINTTQAVEMELKQAGQVVYQMPRE